MEIYICNNKEASKEITLYNLVNVKNNKEINVTSDQLKEAMRKKSVDVLNLTLTSDNRLVTASKHKIEQLGGKANMESKSLRKKIVEVPEYRVKDIESLMDEIIADSVPAYVKDFSKHIKVKSINTEDNIIILELTLGINSYAILQYDKIIYGEERTKTIKDGIEYLNEQDWNRVYGDIIIQLVAISNGKVTYKINEPKLLRARDTFGYGQYITFTRDDLDKYKFNKNCYYRMKDDFGKYILKYLSEQIIEICRNNPEIKNKTNLKKYIVFNENSKEYITTPHLSSESNTYDSIGLCGVLSYAMAVNPILLASPSLSRLVANKIVGDD